MTERDQEAYAKLEDEREKIKTSGEKIRVVLSHANSTSMGTKGAGRKDEKKVLAIDSATAPKLTTAAAQSDFVYDMTQHSYIQGPYTSFAYGWSPFRQERERQIDIHTSRPIGQIGYRKANDDFIPPDLPFSF